MAGKVVHFEVITNGDAKELTNFFADTFDWSIDANNPFNYGVVTPEDAGIGGGIGGTPEPTIPNHVTFYIEVPDPTATLRDIEARGGKTVMGPEEIMPGTAIATFLDPHGNMVGLTKAE